MMQSLRRECIFSLLPIALLAGCSVNHRALELQVSQRQLELSSLQNVKDDLSKPFPPGNRDVDIFISASLINQVLTAADNTEIPITKIPGAVITFHKIRFAARDDSPLLSVDAHAHKGSFDVALAVTAMLLVDDTATSGPVFRVRVLDVAPTLSVSFLKVSRWRFLRNLATLKADELAVQKIAFPLPIQEVIATDVPALAIEQTLETSRKNDSWIRYAITRDPFALSSRLRVDKYLFLRDGIHVYASIL